MLKNAILAEDILSHNLHYYGEIMAGMRDAIARGAFAAWEAGFHAGRAEGECDADGHEDLAEVVDVARDAPEAAAKQRARTVTDRRRLE